MKKDGGAKERGYGHGRPGYLIFMEAPLHNGLKWPSAPGMWCDAVYLFGCALMALADVKKLKLLE